MSKFNRDYYNSRASWREFKVNEFLTVKFERGGPHIYVKDILFHSCSDEFVLMLNFPVEDKTQYSSIDEFVDVIGWSYDDWPSGDLSYNVDKRTEFWGCCSNLQAWYENDYNPNLLISYLAFPLLQILTDAGDPVARKAYKKEIVRRMLRTPPIITTKELGYLDEEERIQILTRVLPEFLKRAKKDKWNYNEFRVFTILINEIKGSELILEFYDSIEEQFLAYLTYFESKKNLGKYGLWQISDFFSDLVNSVNKSKLWSKYCERIITYYKVLTKQIITITEGWDPNFKGELVAFDDQKVPYREIEPYLTASQNALLTGRSYPEGDEMTFLINGEEISINDIASSQHDYGRNFATHLLSKAGIHGYVNVPSGHPLAGVNIPRDVDDIWDSKKEERKFSYQDFMSCLNKNPYYPGMYHSFYKFILTLIEITKDTELFAGFLPDLVIVFPKLPSFPQNGDPNQRPDVYSNLIKAANGTALETETIFQEWKEKNEWR